MRCSICTALSVWVKTDKLGKMLRHDAIIAECEGRHAVWGSVNLRNVIYSGACA